jgi:hypothetical protein
MAINFHVRWHKDLVANVVLSLTRNGLSRK